MADMKCPYCSAVRANKGLLEVHVSYNHRDVNLFERRKALKSARTVEDVDVSGSELVPPRTLCVCGQAIELMEDETEHPAWCHTSFAGKCSEPIPAAGMPTKKDRAELAKSWTQVGHGLEAAGREMREMRASFELIDARMAKLDALMTTTSRVRRATLNQVWDCLVDAGQMNAAAMVMRMISCTTDDNG